MILHSQVAALSAWRTHFDPLQKEPRTWNTLQHNGPKHIREDRRHVSVDKAHDLAEQRRRQHVERLAIEKK